MIQRSHRRPNFTRPNKSHRADIEDVRNAGPLPTIFGRSTALVGLLIMATLLPATLASAAGITIHPNGIVHVGEIVTVTGVGFAPGDEVYIVECFGTACNQESAVPAKISSQGVLPPTHFRLTSVISVPDQCPPRGNLSCYLYASDATRGAKAMAPIQFKKIH